MSTFDSWPVYGVAGTAVSGTNTYNSSSITPNGIGDLAWQVRFTGTETGTLVVQVSNSSDAAIAAGTDTWTTYTLVSLPSISGAMDFLVKCTRLRGVKRARLQYVNATNSGTIFADVVRG